MIKLHRLLKLHRLYKPAGDDGSDTGGSDVVVDEVDDGQDGAADDANSADAGETLADGAGNSDETDEAGTDDVVVTIGDEKAPEEDEQAKAPEWVRELRKSDREKTRKIREQEAEIQRLKGASAPAAVELGAKPTLASCDYDETKFETDLAAWHDRKREVDELARKKAEEEQKSRDQWQSKLADYGKKKTELKVRDFEDAEESAKEVLSVTQQGVIVQGAENPALVVYALGKNPKKAKELASITDPVKFAFAIAKLETALKVTTRKSPPPPERTVRGGGQGSAVDSALERLQAEADKTGDRSKVAKYLRDKKQAVAA